MVKLQLRQLNIPPGQKVLLDNISWTEFENIVTELGEHRAFRLTYDNGILEIMTPLPEDEDDKEILGDLGKYIEVSQSLIFQDIPISVLMSYLRDSKIIGRNKVIKAFRQWIKERISKIN